MNELRPSPEHLSDPYVLQLIQALARRDDEIERLTAEYSASATKLQRALYEAEKEIERLTAELSHWKYVAADYEISCSQQDEIERLKAELKQANAVVEAAREWQANCKTFGLLPDAKLQEALATLKTEPSMPVLECGCGESTCTDCAALETEQYDTALDKLNEARAEIGRLQRRLKSLAYIPYRVTDLPVILEVMAYNGVHWQECSNCREELTSDTCDNGVRLECGQCGSEWWEGELIKSETTKNSDEQGQKK